MTVKEKIKSLLEEAVVYKKHGLYGEVENNYKSVLLLLENNKSIPSRENMIAGIKKKIIAIGRKTEEIKSVADESRLSEEARDVIKTKVFSFSANGKKNFTSALEGGINLARFGQFEEALKEFRGLFHLESIRVDVAKNIMRCFMGINDLEGAAAAYEEWRKKRLITDLQSEAIFEYIREIPDKNGIRQNLISRLEAVSNSVPAEAVSEFSDDLKLPDLSSDVSEEKSEDELFNENGFGAELSDDFVFEDMSLKEPSKPHEKEAVSINGMVLELERDTISDEGEVEDFSGGDRFIDFVKVSGNPQTLIPNEDVIEINSIGISVITGERAGEEINLDVITQNGNQVSVIIPQSEDDLLTCIEVGFRVNEIMCYSSIAIFSGYGIVTSKIVIGTGPQKGNFGIDLRIKVE